MATTVPLNFLFGTAPVSFGPSWMAHEAGAASRIQDI